MKRATLMIAVCAILLFTAQAEADPGRSLDPLLTFSDPRTCTPETNFRRLLESLLPDTTELPIRTGQPDVPAYFQGAFGKTILRKDGNRYSAIVPVKGMWLGLPVVALTARGWLGGDGAGFMIAVRASRATLLHALQAAGFAPPARGKRLLADDGDEGTMQVRGRAGYAELDCS